MPDDTTRDPLLQEYDKLDHILAEIDSLLDTQLSAEHVLSVQTPLGEGAPKAVLSTAEMLIADHEDQFDECIRQMEDLFEGDDMGQRYLEHTASEYDLFIRHVKEMAGKQADAVKYRLYEYGSDASALVAKFLLLYILRHTADASISHAQRELYLEYLHDRRFFDEPSDVQFEEDGVYPSIFNFCKESCRQAVIAHQEALLSGKRGFQQSQKKAFLFDRVVNALEKNNEYEGKKEIVADVQAVSETAARLLEKSDILVAHTGANEESSRVQQLTNHMRHMMGLLGEFKSTLLRVECAREVIDRIRHDLIEQSCEYLIEHLLPNRPAFVDSASSAHHYYKTLVKRRSYTESELVSLRGTSVKMNSLVDLFTYHLKNPVTARQKEAGELLRYTLDLMSEVSVEKVPVAV